MDKESEEVNAEDVILENSNHELGLMQRLVDFDASGRRGRPYHEMKCSDADLALATHSCWAWRIPSNFRAE